MRFEIIRNFSARFYFTLIAPLEFGTQIIMRNIFRFYYPNEDGELTERIAYNSEPSEYPGCINAYYQHNDEARSFKIEKMISLVDLVSGKNIENPWEYFGILNSVANRIDAATFQILSAIKALKFFTYSTRGFAKRERDHILRFIRQNCRVDEISDYDLHEWLVSLWVGDVRNWRDGNVDEYHKLLISIPPHLIQKCHELALIIATGSGRKMMSPLLRQRIDMEFSKSPIVQKPENIWEED